jgi:hypothetical protein
MKNLPKEANPIENTSESANIVHVDAWKTPEDSGRPEMQTPASTTTSRPASRRPKTETALPSESFDFRGRNYRIFKRDTDPAANWYYQYQVGSKRYPTSLQTPNKKTAIENAKLIILAKDKGRDDDLARIRARLNGRPVDAIDTPAYASIEKYLEIYEATPTGFNRAESRHGAALALKRIITTAEPTPGRMDQLEPAFHAYHRKAAAAIEAAVNDQGKQQSLKRSFNSTLRNAAAVFSEDAVFILAQLTMPGGKKLVLPDFTVLRKTIKRLLYPKAKKTAEQYNRPDQTVLDKTLKEWLALPRNEFLAVGLALLGSTRRSEIRQADWDWFKTYDGYVWLDARGTFKDQTGVLRTRVLEPFYSIFMAHAKAQGWYASSGQILNGVYWDFDRNVSSWMKGLGWNTKKHLHALRAWAGSLVYTKYGAGMACLFCRHGHEQTTKDFYGWMRDEWHDKDTPVIINGQPVQWAKESEGAK